MSLEQVLKAIDSMDLSEVNTIIKAANKRHKETYDKVRYNIYVYHNAYPENNRDDLGYFADVNDDPEKIFEKIKKWIWRRYAKEANGIRRQDIETVEVTIRERVKITNPNMDRTTILSMFWWEWTFERGEWYQQQQEQTA